MKYALQLLNSPCSLYYINFWDMHMHLGVVVSIVTLKQEGLGV